MVNSESYPTENGSFRLCQTDIRIADFGLAVFEPHEDGIQTRSYRAPEVILELGWNESADVWSIACILMEMFLGKRHFICEDDQDQLMAFESTFGQLPEKMIADFE